jgi:1-acyl-sn-glycerol-3-phosphate acyltransferase
MTGGVVLAGSVARKAFWRLALRAAGGLRVDGALPPGPCVLVANHASHADTAALLAALPARRRPAVAAAADYWFARADRRLLCRLLVGGFPVRRGGGGSGDLSAARALLADGRDVIVFPEGTRSRDGTVGAFRSGAALLAERAGVPLVPVGIAGTREVFPVHGRPGHGRVCLRIGAPTDDLERARAEVARLARIPRGHRS